MDRGDGVFGFLRIVMVGGLERGTFYPTNAYGGVVARLRSLYEWYMFCGSLLMQATS
ncbi:hypothetical protein BDV3_006832 [Batrachochytrium dendrobatidis]|nr:hypothetical protein QVD99_007435 [Batrachochytrium dendrobatidis]